MAKLKGNVYRIGSSWRVKYPLGKDPATGKYRTIQEPYPTKELATARLARLRVEEMDGVLIAPSRLTVAQFSGRWLDAKAATVRQATIRTYTNRVAILNRYLGHRVLGRLDAPAVLAFHAAALKEHSPSEVHHTHVVLSTMLNDAVRWNIIGRNPAKGVKPPAVERPPRTVWGREQMVRLLTFIEGRDDEAMWRLLMTTGIRVGELCGLKWDDLFGAQLTIRRTMTIGVGNRVHFNEPKSKAGHRVLALSSQTVAALERERERQRSHRARVGDWWNADGWMFPSSRTGAYTYTSTVGDKLRALCKLAGIPYIGAHGIRHTYGTDMMRAGVSPRVVQRRMGHSDVRVTLNLYSHPDEAMDEAAADVIERPFVADSLRSLVIADDFPQPQAKREM